MWNSGSSMSNFTQFVLRMIWLFSLGVYFGESMRLLSFLCLDFQIQSDIVNFLEILLRLQSLGKGLDAGRRLTHRNFDQNMSWISYNYHPNIALLTLKRQQTGTEGIGFNNKAKKISWVLEHGKMDSETFTKSFFALRS